MRIKIFENTREVKSVNNEPIISKHTGKFLSSCSLTIKIHESDQPLLENYLDRSKTDGVFEVDESDTVLKVYDCLNHSYSYTPSNGQNIIYTYTIDLKEREELNIEELNIAGVGIKPYSYNEVFDGSALIINARIKLSLEEKARLVNKTIDEKYFTVVRKGISEESKQMRFGKIIWSDHKDFIKESIVLVEAIYDEENRHLHPPFDPEMSNIQHILAFTNKYTELLSNLLVSKGILLSKEISDINEQAKESMSLRGFYRVDDIDLLEE